MEKFSLEAETQTGETQKNETAEVLENPSKPAEIRIPIKFNKEIKEITLDEAGTLAQKGLKFDAIAADYESLKQLANANGQNVSEYLHTLQKQQCESRKEELTARCGGNEEIAEYVLELEGANRDDAGFAELQEAFPAFRKPEDLPEEVRERAKLKGRLLLDEYLRYRLENKRLSERAVAAQKNADASSVGSLTDRAGGQDPETLEFLKGLWK
ncbi:MAG: hypothetical protein IJT66_02030 [Clostridia bacterium]|nr:hypothetical protein [Clostridia bacterium]